MNPTLMTGTMVVTCALVSYSIAVIAEQRGKTITRFVLVFLTLGICLDVTATALMIIGSHNIPLTPHGILGYTALAAMLTDTVWIWKTRLKGICPMPVPRKLHLYTRAAYAWWVLAYVAGGIIAAFVVGKE